MLQPHFGLSVRLEAVLYKSKSATMHHQISFTSARHDMSLNRDNNTE